MALDCTAEGQAIARMPEKGQGHRHVTNSTSQQLKYMYMYPTR